mmetsp:Transcript_10030/g.29653  ORF Transcript_10030/g.29653 Transcript_10030/m.29653 type:complete len:216 (-) Transcript_10030:1853-2500(-)
MPSSSYSSSSSSTSYASSSSSSSLSPPRPHAPNSLANAATKSAHTKNQEPTPHNVYYRRHHAHTHTTYHNKNATRGRTGQSTHSLPLQNSRGVIMHRTLSPPLSTTKPGPKPLRTLLPNGRLLRLLGGLELLRLPHVVVLAAERDEFVVAALLIDEPVVEHDDLVRVLDGAEAVRDDDAGAVLPQGVERGLYALLGAAVEGRRGLIQEHHGRVLE